MREGSREQTGCFLATLMVASAAYAVRSVLRTFHGFGADAESAATPAHVALVVALAVGVFVLALFALKLKRWALVAYAVACVLGIAFSFLYSLSFAVPLIIGLCTVALVSFARRDLF